MQFFMHIWYLTGETMQLCEALHFLRILVDPLNKEKAKLEMEKQKLSDRNEENQSVDFMFLPEVSWSVHNNGNFWVGNVSSRNRLASAILS